MTPNSPRTIAALAIAFALTLLTIAGCSSTSTCVDPDGDAGPARDLMVETPEMALDATPREGGAAFSLDQLKQGGQISIPAGSFSHTGEIVIDKATTIVGAGRDRTTLDLFITRDEAGLRILSSDVTIKDLNIRVHLVHKLTEPGHAGGGRGEYGTGITVGRYLTLNEQPRIENITIERVAISRDGFVAAALTLIGHVTKVTIRDIDLRDAHSTALIMHWGGKSSHAPAPQALEMPGFEVFESYHPNTISISNVSIARVARFLIISSSYKVDVERIEGTTAELLFMLPGDEIDRFAQAADKGRVGSDISLKDISAHVYTKDSDHLVRVTSIGTSKTDQQKRLLPYKNLLVEGVFIKSVTRVQNKTFRYGLNLNGATGSNLRFENVVLSDVAFKPFETGTGALPAYGVYLNSCAGITLDAITARSHMGIGIVDSTDVAIKGSTFSSKGPSSLTSYGLFFKETAVGGNSSISVEDTTLINYDYGIRYPNPADCKDYNLSKVTVLALIQAEQNKQCL
jgi:hypothetical protein